MADDQKTAESTQKSEIKSAKFDKECKNVQLYGWCKFENSGCQFKHSKVDSSLTSSISHGTPITVSSEQIQDSLENLNIQSAADENPEDYPVGFTQPVVDESGFIQPLHIDNLTYRVTPIQPLEHHLYMPTKQFNKSISGRTQNLNSFFVDEDLRQGLINDTSDMNNFYFNPSDQHLSIGQYHSVILIQQNIQNIIQGQSISIYKGISSVDGSFVRLIRLENFLLSQEKLLLQLDSFINGLNDFCGIIHLKEAFSTRAFNDNSVVFVYEYSTCKSFQEYIIANPQKQFSASDFWSILCQLVNITWKVHQVGQSIKLLTPSTVFRTRSGNLKLGFCGIAYLIQPTQSTTAALNSQQLQDLLSIVQFILEISGIAYSYNFQEMLANFFQIHCPTNQQGHTQNQELKHLILFVLDASHTELNNVQSGYLVEKGISIKILNQTFSILGPRLLNELSRLQNINEELEEELIKELENGRLFRLITKLNSILERDGLLTDSSWSQTGDRYILSLMRDYIFHQQAPSYNMQSQNMHIPVLNLAHVIRCFNKLDCGSIERIMLVSRDQSNCLLLSWKDLKHCLDRCFQEIVTASYRIDKN